MLDRQHEHAAVADFAGPRGPDDRLDDLLDDVVGTTTSISTFGSRLTLYSLPR